MSINATGNVVLAAPRPVRLAAPVPFSQFHAAIVHRPQPKTAVRFVSAPVDAFERLRMHDENAEEDPKSDVVVPSESDHSISPRPSPRAAPPSEALEEFLSILRPSTYRFPPTSPVLRARNVSRNAFAPYRRPQSCRLSPIPSDALGLTLADMNDSTEKDNESVIYQFKILGSRPLASPVPRNQTRNPFQHWIANDIKTITPAIQHLDVSPSLEHVAVSPSAIPLPTPTPSESEMDVEILP